MHGGFTVNIFGPFTFAFTSKQNSFDLFATGLIVGLIPLNNAEMFPILAMKLLSTVLPCVMVCRQTWELKRFKHYFLHRFPRQTALLHFITLFTSSLITITSSCFLPYFPLFSLSLFSTCIRSHPFRHLLDSDKQGSKYLAPLLFPLHAAPPRCPCQLSSGRSSFPFPL